MGIYKQSQDSHKFAQERHLAEKMKFDQELAASQRSQRIGEKLQIELSTKIKAQVSCMCSEGISSVNLFQLCRMSCWKRSGNR